MIHDNDDEYIADVAALSDDGDDKLIILEKDCIDHIYAKSWQSPNWDLI